MAKRQTKAAAPAAPKGLKGLYVVTRSFAGGGGVRAMAGEYVKDPPTVYKPFSRKATRDEEAAWKLLNP